MVALEPHPVKSSNNKSLGFVAQQDPTTAGPKVLLSCDPPTVQPKLLRQQDQQQFAHWLTVQRDIFSTSSKSPQDLQQFFPQTSPKKVHVISPD